MTKNSREFPHVFLMTSIRNTWEIDKWCEERFGKRWNVIDNREGVWCCFWRGFSPGPGSYEWLFLNKEDAILFALRWYDFEHT